MQESNVDDTSIELRPPNAEDGLSVYQLVSECPPLDQNSAYCNLLQCSHFASTSVAAIHEGGLVGFISAYLHPERPNTLFIWQVAVSATVRGQGLASRMIKHLLNRPCCSDVQYLETSITESNKASWALFKGIARQLKAELGTSVMFDHSKHFGGLHETEGLVRIGPF